MDTGTYEEDNERSNRHYYDIVIFLQSKLLSYHSKTLLYRSYFAASGYSCERNMVTDQEKRYKTIQILYRNRLQNGSDVFGEQMVD